MHIAELTLAGFRCFGHTPTAIRFDDVTALIGNNGSGKSAVLIALSRLFGLTGEERKIVRDDFHLGAGESIDDADESGLALFVEARLEFPELENADADAEELFRAIPLVFRNMAIASPGGPLFCRVRLQATWKPGNLPDGEIEQSLCWITTAGDPSDEPPEPSKRPVASVDRQHIHVHYVPASRDPGRQLRTATKSSLKRLLDAARWSEEFGSKIGTSTQSIKELFDAEVPVETLTAAINKSWSALHDGNAWAKVELGLETQTLEDVMRQVIATLTPSHQGGGTRIERLSDGLRSLLYFSLVHATFNVEQAAFDAQDNGDGKGEEYPFDSDSLSPPILTVFAIEEPENHLSPHLLGKVMRLLRKLTETGRGQVVVSSHSPSLLARIEPQEVRHLKHDSHNGVTQVAEIDLPEDDQEADKFIRQAVRRFPEMYFARLVILGEGDSEQVILPRLLEANRIPADPYVVSIVPLGGRHVNHLWRLLQCLDIPHLTLLDLDREREHGGWSRIKYVYDQLLLLGHDRASLLGSMDEAEYASVSTWDAGDQSKMKEWIGYIQQFGVYFSSPLDLDFLMYRRFWKTYRETSPGAPRARPSDESRQRRYDEQLKMAVLGNPTARTYSQDEVTAFRWYRYLFLGRSKPATHLSACTHLTNKDLRTAAPAVLKQLASHARNLLLREPDQET